MSLDVSFEAQKSNHQLLSHAVSYFKTADEVQLYALLFHACPLPAPDAQEHLSTGVSAS